MIIGLSKGKSAIRINREQISVKGVLFGHSFWSRGYCISTAGYDADSIRKYVEEQEKHEKDEDQGKLMLG